MVGSSVDFFPNTKADQAQQFCAADRGPHRYQQEVKKNSNSKSAPPSLDNILCLFLLFLALFYSPPSSFWSIAKLPAPLRKLTKVRIRSVFHPSVIFTFGGRSPFSQPAPSSHFGVQQRLPCDPATLLCKKSPSLTRLAPLSSAPPPQFKTTFSPINCFGASTRLNYFLCPSKDDACSHTLPPSPSCL